MALVSVQKVAVALNVTGSRIVQLVGEGMPKAARGKYDLGQCMAWYIRFLQEALKKRAVPVGDDYVSNKDERARLLRAEAELKEMELASMRRQLVAIPDVEKAMSDLISETKARVLSIPARVAPELVGETSRVMIQARIEKSLKEALSQLANHPNAPIPNPS